MLKKISLVGILLIALSCKADPRFTDSVEGSKNLAPETYHGTIAHQILDMIEQYNYKKVAVNDSISSLLLTQYIKSIDPNKTYFLEEDILLFEKSRHLLDDDIRNNDLSFAYYVFNVFQKRYLDCIKYSLSVASQPFKFERKKQFKYNREKENWIKTDAEMKSWWYDKVTYDLLNLKMAGSDSTKSVETLKKRYEDLISQSEKLNNQDVFQFYMNAFTEVLDPHTNYFNPNNAANFNIEQSRTLEGIGATLSIENEMITIASIVVGGPADKSKKLHIKDKIIGVAQGSDGAFTDIIGWRLDNAIQLIRGKKGTIAKLKIIPSGKDATSEPVIIEIVRDRIVLEDQSAKGKIKTVTQNGKIYKIGIINIPQFYMDFKAYQEGVPDYKSTTRDVRKLIDSLKKQDIEGLVIDLRSNGGGSLVEAIDLTGLFIRVGPVVQVRDIENRVQVNMDQNPNIEWSGPLCVMVDRFSASASEIFAGAIQDWNRGVIIGNQTFGKGTVQTAIDMQRLLPDLGTKSGQTNLTMAKFYRISGGSTQHKGVVPDIQFPTIFKADKYGESSHPAALAWDEIHPCNYVPLNNLSLINQELNTEHQKRMQKSIDYQWLVDDIKEMNKEENETTVSLNEAEFKIKRDKDAEKALDRLNKKRVAKGLKALKKGEDKPANEQDTDFVSDETLQIIGNLIQKTK